MNTDKQRDNGTASSADRRMPAVDAHAGPDNPRWSETLRDGTRVLIRPVTHADREAERAFIEGLSEQSRRFRFLGQMHIPSDRLLDSFTDIDYVHNVAFAAVMAMDGGEPERIVGVSRYSLDSDGRNCECAVTVDDHWQSRGLGTLLMKHLIEIAREHGIERMVSLDAADNIRMQKLAEDLGFTTRLDPDDACLVIHTLDL